MNDVKNCHNNEGANIEYKNKDRLLSIHLSSGALMTVESFEWSVC